MKTYPTFFLIVLLAITCSTEVFSQTSLGDTSNSTTTLVLIPDGKHNYSTGSDVATGSAVETWYDLSGNGVNIIDGNLVFNNDGDDGNLDLDPIQVFNQAGICVNGKVVFNILSTSQLEVDFLNLPSGIYTLKTKNGLLMVKKK